MNCKINRLISFSVLNFDWSLLLRVNWGVHLLIIFSPYECWHFIPLLMVTKVTHFDHFLKKQRWTKKNDLLDLLIVFKMYPKYNKGNENMTCPIPFGCLKGDISCSEHGLFRTLYSTWYFKSRNNWHTYQISTWLNIHKISAEFGKREHLGYFTCEAPPNSSPSSLEEDRSVLNQLQ